MNSPVDNSFRLKKNLPKKEIIRGFNAYTKLIKSSKKKIKGKIKVFYRYQSDNIRTNDFPPPVLKNVQVGFIISKRSLKSAVLRNKIKRQMREAYRNAKPFLLNYYKKNGLLSLIFTLSKKGTDEVNINKKLAFEDLKKDFEDILSTLSKEL